ncbi:hypothetical protein KIW84_062744 [Lathyrus oleraceus]|uniref:Retrovirus-related Pol polyprotein from transposon TNT 1-94-like beta-barrel domain-containing protein n=1 Tax=Pisum sativum TaxID=3888 RepID=A0A9D4W7U8_PEA|nr:hypothetical protein KIW84_062744 [Pisum sativum]
MEIQGGQEDEHISEEASIPLEFCGIQIHVGHLAKDCRIEKKVEETTNLTLEAEANEDFLLMAQNEINTNDNVWYLDSGASNHMCGHKHLFKEMRKIEDGNVSFGDASKVKVEGKGTIRYLQKHGLMGSIQDVYYVPNLKTNILSLRQLTKKGYSILMKERILYLKDKLGHLIARVEMERNRMYKLNLINVREKCLQVSVEDKASLWHLRFGHLHHAGLRRDVRINEASKWDWNNSTEAIVEVEESSVAVPPNISTTLDDSDNEDEPTQPRIRSLQDLYDSTSEVHLVCLLVDAENISFEETVRDKKWKSAMDEEMKAIIHNNTWELVELPKGS